MTREEEEQEEQRIEELIARLSATYDDSEVPLIVDHFERRPKQQQRELVGLSESSIDAFGIEIGFKRPTTTVDDGNDDRDRQQQRRTEIGGLDVATEGIWSDEQEEEEEDELLRRIGDELELEKKSRGEGDENRNNRSKGRDGRENDREEEAEEEARSEIEREWTERIKKL